MSRFVTFGHEKLGQITEGASSGLQSGLSGTKRVLSGIVHTGTPKIRTKIYLTLVPRFFVIKSRDCA